MNVYNNDSWIPIEIAYSNFFHSFDFLFYPNIIEWFLIRPKPFGFMFSSQLYRYVLFYGKYFSLEVQMMGKIWCLQYKRQLCLCFQLIQSYVNDGLDMLICLPKASSFQRNHYSLYPEIEIKLRNQKLFSMCLRAVVK